MVIDKLGDRNIDEQQNYSMREVFFRHGTVSIGFIAPRDSRLVGGFRLPVTVFGRTRRNYEKTTLCTVQSSASRKFQRMAHLQGTMGMTATPIILFRDVTPI
jgi:hypothetical protein